MLQNIEHIIVLMLENRSFDHMLGYLDHPDPSYPGLNSSHTNPDRSGTAIPTTDSARATIRVSPGHEYLEVLKQISPDDVINNQGFVTQFSELCEQRDQPDLGEQIMDCQSPRKIPVLATLAKEFAVCTRWHCSVPGMTWPNRNFAHTGTSDGEVNIEKRFYYNKTIFELLGDNKKDWRIYSDNDAFAQATVFRKLWWFTWENRFQSIDDFIDKASTGHLPHYSFIEPDHFIGHSSSQHPMNNTTSSSDFKNAENLILKIYKALTMNPTVWEKSLFIITYDEHGGFYDREPPPKGPQFRVKESNTEYDFKFDLLGPRVPAVLVSPYIAQGTIDDSLYDHTSIIKTIRKIHLPDSEPLSQRENAVSECTSQLTLSTPRSGAEIPHFEDIHLHEIKSLETFNLIDYEVEPEIDEFQESLLWLSEQLMESPEYKEVSFELFTPDKSKDELSIIERIQLAKDFQNERIRNRESRLVLLHTSTGEAIEQPNIETIEAAINNAIKTNVWMEDVPNVIVDWNPNGTLTLLIDGNILSLDSDSKVALKAFNSLLKNDLSELKSLFNFDE